jgi:hypothetical protein
MAISNLVSGTQLLRSKIGAILDSFLFVIYHSY